MNTTKWLPLETEETLKIYDQCRDLENATVTLSIKILNIQNAWNSNVFSNKMCGKNYVESMGNIQALENLLASLSKLVKCYFKINPKLSKAAQNNECLVMEHKKTLMLDKLCWRRFTLSYLLNNLINSIFKSCLHREDQCKLLEISFGLTTLYNELSFLSSRTFTSKFNICSNSCPILIHQQKKISIMKILQVLAQSRAEFCCHSLIDCLLTNYRPCNPVEADTCSDNSSLEIYQALTRHMTPPAERNERKNKEQNVEPQSSNNLCVPQKRVKELKQTNNDCQEVHNSHLIEVKNAVNENKDEIPLSSICDPTSESEFPYTSLNEYYDETDVSFNYPGVSTLHDLILREEMYVDVVLDTALRISPTIYGNDGVKKSKAGEMCLSNRLAVHVLEYYQNILWGDVGSYLEHIVLWWGASPLASRSPHSSQHLREWLLSLNKNDVPQLMLVALQSLADALGCHVTSTSWDKLFRLCFGKSLDPTPVKSEHYGTPTITQCSQIGANFSEMLHDLVMLSNLCEVTCDYIMGAPVDELPIVEQIPTLHRLDHSVHTCRLWSLAETRRLANMWDMNCFFRIMHNDIQMCLEQLSNLRFADHTLVIDSGKLGVHEHVCAKMREKLVSEIKVNIEKLKKTPDECIQVLASICGTTSLAHLTMIFPSNSSWQAVKHPPTTEHTQYVHDYLDRILLPVVEATSDKIIVNMILKIMCESWLHHIYVYKVKFSHAAAEQLLVDFDAVRVWISKCQAVTEITRRQLLNNEVLRRCEGVGRLLLHSPGESISMHDVTQPNQRVTVQQADADNPEDCGEIMPAEMYVPNQQQWLKLRAGKTKRRRNFCCMTITM